MKRKLSREQIWIVPAGSSCGIVLILFARAGFLFSCVHIAFILCKWFVVIKAVRVLSLWRSCLLNIGVVAATPYLHLWEPENRLTDPSNDESTYPVVDWVNSYTLSHLKESITSLFLIVKSWILIELPSSGPSPKTKPLLHSKLGDRICNIPFLSTLILPRF